MMHRNRRHKIEASLTIEQAAEKLANHTQVVCSAFQVGPLLLLNDSTSEDGAQEYAVVRDGRQIESLTVSWMKEAKLLEFLRHLISDPDSGVDMGAVSIRPHGSAYCSLCG